MTHGILRLLCCVNMAVAPIPQALAQSRVQTAAPPPAYAPIATQVVGAPLIVDAKIRTSSRLKPAESPGLAAGRVRFYIEADVLALIRGTTAMPTRISYVADIALDSRGKAPKLNKQRVLLFARPVAGRADQIQLVTLDSQMAWTPALDSRVRGITRELLAPNAPPAITGIGNAFHVPGSLPGEGETQIFLQTPTGDPVSLQILRRPGEQPRWGVSLGDIVDDSAGSPQRDTLLWYRLACGLPRALPAGTLESDDAQSAAIAQEDYATVLRDLGPCT
jgi:hypothetical protein